MKTKKLIAILTIVALMMTLVPMAAFAAETPVEGASVALSSRLAGATGVDYTLNVKLPAMANNDTAVLKIVNNAGAPITGFSTTATITKGDGTPVDANTASVASSANGEITVTAGTAGVAAGNYIIKVTGVTNPAEDTYKIMNAATTPVQLTTFKTTARSASATIVAVDKETAAAGSLVTFTVLAKDNDGNPLSSGDTVDIWIKSSSDLAQFGTVTDYPINQDTTDTSMTGEKGKKITATVVNGVTKFTISSSIAGTATITLYNKEANDTTKLIYGEKATTLTFTADSAVAKRVDLDGSWLQKTFNVPGANTKVQAGITMTLTATVSGEKGGIAGQTVTFYKKVNGGNLEQLGTATTDVMGIATYKCSQSKAGMYEFVAKSGTATDGTFKVNVHHGAPTSITADTASYAELGPVGLTFVIKDAFGNIFNARYTDGTGAEFIDNQTLEFGDPNFPAGKYVSDATRLTGVVYSVPEGATNPGVTSNTNGADALGNANGKIKAVFNADKAGAYTIIGSITNTGHTALVTVNVGKFGTVQKIALTAPASIQPTSTTGQLKVHEIDENGIKKEITAANFPGKVVFSSSDVSLIEVGTDGKLTAKGDAKTRGVATITATHLATGFTASADVAIVGDPVDIIVTPTVTDKVAKISMQLVDAQGNKANYGALTPFTIIDIAGVSFTDVVSFNAATGVGSFTATATDAGQKSITVITAKGLTKTFTINFATPESDIPGARNINMYIGAKGFFADGEEVSCDVAPFIGEGNRTFVELRNLANAMGVDNDDITYENGVITLSRADMTLVLTIGSNAIQKTVDGVTTTITSDVAPYVVAEAGRTVLPLRAVGEAFGYTVNYNAANQLITISR